MGNDDDFGPAFGIRGFDRTPAREITNEYQPPVLYIL